MTRLIGIGKGRKERAVFLSDRTRDALDAYRARPTKASARRLNRGSGSVHAAD